MTGSEEQPVSSAYYISMILISRLSESHLIDSESPQPTTLLTTLTDFKFCLPTTSLPTASSREMSQILITKIISFKCLLNLLLSLVSPVFYPPA